MKITYVRTRNKMIWAFPNQSLVRLKPNRMDHWIFDDMNSKEHTLFLLKYYDYNKIGMI